MSEAMIIVDHLDRDGENVVDKSTSLSVFCSSVCVHYNAQKWKSSKKRGRPGNTNHVNDVTWTRVRCSGRQDPHSNNVLDFII